jgi:hypothetical protein
MILVRSLTEGRLINLKRLLDNNKELPITGIDLSKKLQELYLLTKKRYRKKCKN